MTSLTLIKTVCSLQSDRKKASNCKKRLQTILDVAVD